MTSLAEKEKMIHDMNSGLGSLNQAMELLLEQGKDNPELVDQIAPLSQKKISSLLDIWEQLKPLLK